VVTHILVLRFNNGGSLYLDDANQPKNCFGKTFTNLAEVSLRVFQCTKKVSKLLVKKLKKRIHELATKFFLSLQFYLFCGRGLAQHIWDDLERWRFIHWEEVHADFPGLVATETAPSATFCIC